MADLNDVLAKERELTTVYARMDADRKLYELEKFVLKDLDNNKVRGVLSVTLNYPAIFAAHVQAIIAGAQQQVVVTGGQMLSTRLKDKKTNLIERFLDAGFIAADRRRRARGLPGVRPYVVEKFDIRGAGVTRMAFRKGPDGKLIPDILPIDPRYFTHDSDDDGMVWGASKTWRSGRRVLRQYPKAKVDPDSTGIPVYDVWDRDRNIIYVDGEEVHTEDNAWGYPPFPLSRVSLGSMLGDEDSMKNQSESIFYLIRTLIHESNLLASVMQTINLRTVLPPQQYESPEGEQATVPEGSDEIGAVTPVPMGGGLSLVPMGDLKQAGRLMHSILESMIQAGSLSLTSFGNLQFPLSAVALVELGESSNQVFLPRLAAKGLLYQDMAAMMINQIEKTGMDEVDFGTMGHKQSFSVADLKGEYDIEYFYTVKSPETDAARMAIADAAKGLLDTDTILRNIMHMENPDEIRAKRRSDEAEVLSPTLKAYRIAKDLEEQGNHFDAAIIASEMNLTLADLNSGKPPTALPSQNGSAGNVLPPVLDRGTTSASNTRAKSLEGEVPEGVGEE